MLLGVKKTEGGQFPAAWVSAVAGEGGGVRGWENKPCGTRGWNVAGV
jgi:hypothetical protein